MLQRVNSPYTLVGRDSNLSPAANDYTPPRNHKEYGKYENINGTNSNGCNPRRMHIIMSQEEVAAGKKSKWLELEITGTIRNLSPQLWHLSHLTSLYLNDNNLSRLPGEISRLSSLMYLDLSSNKLRCLPPEIGDLVRLRELLLHNNYLRSLPFEMGRLFQLLSLGLKGNPLSQEIMSIYNDINGTSKLISYMLENIGVQTPPPPVRPWIPLAHPDRTKPVCIFTVMCYNVLCDKFATRQMYGYCQGWALNWEYRRKGIIDEIRQYSADIISLQEVETEQFYAFFLPELKLDGYDGIFAPKSRAKTMIESERKYVDGCAIFYKVAKFSLVKERLIEFNLLAMANAEGSDNMLNRVMTKDNIGLIAMLQTREAAWENVTADVPLNIPLLLNNVHIHWDPEYCDVKLIQTMMLLHELKQMVEEYQHLDGSKGTPSSTKFDCSSIPFILCGDFNSLPNSGVVEFLSKGRVSTSHQDFKELAYKSCLKKINPCDKLNEFTHTYNLEKAYGDEVMPYTNYTFDFKGVIDYIFFGKSQISVLGVLGPIDQEWLKEQKVIGCPHIHVPSDHFPLLAELQLTLPEVMLAQHAQKSMQRGSLFQR